MYSIVIQLSIYIYSFFFFRFFPPIHGFSHRSESPDPHVRFPSLGVWGWEKEPPRASGFEGQQGLSAGVPQDWGNKFHSRQRTKFHVCWDPARAVTPLEPESGLSADLEGLLGRWGRRWLSVGARTQVAKGPEEIDGRELSLRSSFWHEDLAPPNSLQATELLF